MHRGAVEMRWAKSHAHNALHAKVCSGCQWRRVGVEEALVTCARICRETQSWRRCAVRSACARRLRTGLSSWELLVKKNKGGGAEDLLGHSFLLCVM